jgi:cysteine-rich repeat protein
MRASVCGDGVVEDAEVCDDGDLAPDDGCSPACKPAGQLLWTRTRSDPAGLDDAWSNVAIAPDGRLVLVGWQTKDNFTYDRLVSVLSPAGELLWEQVIAGDEASLGGFGSLAVGPDGTIFAGGSRGMATNEAIAELHAFTSQGTPLWTFEEAFVPEHSSWIDSIDLVDSVLVSTGSRRDDTGDGGWTIIVRRHDLSTGAEVWQRTLAHQQPLVSMGAIAIAGDQLLVAGTSGAADELDRRPLRRMLPLLQPRRAATMRQPPRQHTFGRGDPHDHRSILGYSLTQAWARCLA